MKIAVLVYWPITLLEKDDPSLHAIYKIISGQRYWFFKHMPDSVEVDVIGIPAFFEKVRLRKFTLHNLWQTISLLPKMGQYDAVVSHHCSNGTFLSLARKVFRLKKPPHIIVDVELPAIAKPSQRLRARIAKYIFSSVDAIIYHVKVQREYYLSVLGLPQAKIHFLPFGMDHEYFSPSVGEPTGDYILSQGDGSRDYETLLDAARSVNAKIKIISACGLQICLQNYGPPPENIEVYGFMPISQLKVMIAEAKFVVLSLQSVPYSIGHGSLLMAMAMAKAVVVSNVPAMIGYVIDGDTALLCQHGNAADMAEKINYLLANPAEAQRIGKNAREALLANFTEEMMAKGIYQVLTEVTGGVEENGS